MLQGHNEIRGIASALDFINPFQGHLWKGPCAHNTLFRHLDFISKSWTQSEFRTKTYYQCWQLANNILSLLIWNEFAMWDYSQVGKS